MTMQDWYRGRSYQAERIAVGDGKVIANVDMERLVQAMADFGVPPAGMTSWSPGQQAALAPVLLASAR
jgi:hypothetical protein